MPMEPNQVCPSLREPMLNVLASRSGYTAAASKQAGPQARGWLAGWRRRSATAHNLQVIAVPRCCISTRKRDRESGRATPRKRICLSGLISGLRFLCNSLFVSTHTHIHTRTHIKTRELGHGPIAGRAVAASVLPASMVNEKLKKCRTSLLWS
jgi:hypothetical protein